MKIKKKTAMAISFIIGTCMFTTTALAEVTTASPYEKAKDSLKYTAEKFSTSIPNYTIETTIQIKDNGKVFYSDSSVNKYDNKSRTTEDVSKTIKKGVKEESYYYIDKNMIINKDSDQNIYYLTKFTKPSKGYKFSNPFKEEGFKDIEKIADAAIGNLKDLVVSNENKDGSKQISGSIKESQIPSLINSVASYMMKSQGSVERSYIPSIVKDICIKNATGKMNVDKNGILKDILLEGNFYGKDSKDAEHNINLNIFVKVKDTNNTKIQKPNLKGKKVEKIVNNEFHELNKAMYIGTYKRDLIIVKDAKFVKIGEGILNITNINDKGIDGIYKENYLKGYEKYKSNISEITFHGKYDAEDKHNARFKLKGVRQDCMISLQGQSNPGVYFYIPQKNEVLTDGNFSRVF